MRAGRSGAVQTAKMRNWGLKKHLFGSIIVQECSLAESPFLIAGVF
jgi:hypothetical protein